MTTKELVQRRLSHWENSKIENEEIFNMVCEWKIEELKIILNNLD